MSDANVVVHKNVFSASLNNYFCMLQNMLLVILFQYFYFTGSILLESKILPDTAYQKQQVCNIIMIISKMCI